jgi:hypothetical protein
LIAIAHSAHEIRSPVESSMSISRGSGVDETSSAIAIRSSVVCPRADRTATTRLPASRCATILRAARLSRSASATDVPPNFMTMVLGIPRSKGTGSCAAGPRRRSGASAGQPQATTQRDLITRRRRALLAGSPHTFPCLNPQEGSACAGTPPSFRFSPPGSPRLPESAQHRLRRPTCSP